MEDYTDKRFGSLEAMMHEHTGATGCIAAIDAKVVSGSGKVTLPSGEVIPRAVKVFAVVAADGQILCAEAHYHTGKDEAMFKQTRLYNWLTTKKLPVFKRYVNGFLIVVPGFFSTDHQMDLFSEFATDSENLVSGSITCEEDYLPVEKRYVNQLIKKSNSCCELTFGTVIQQFSSFDTLPPCGKPCTRNLLLVLIPLKLRNLILQSQHTENLHAAGRTKMVGSYVRKAGRSTYDIVVKAHTPLAKGLDMRSWGPKQLVRPPRAIPPQGELLAAAGRVHSGSGTQADLNALFEFYAEMYGREMLTRALEGQSSRRNDSYEDYE